MDELDRNAQTHKGLEAENPKDSSSSVPPMDESDQNGIFRSMKINDASKTPYSDATQVRLRLPFDSI